MILIYPGNLGHQADRLADLLRDHQIGWLDDRMKPMTMKEAVQNVLPERRKTTGNIPFLYFSEVPVAEISRLQSELEKTKLPIRAMAVSTEENLGWTLEKLMDEVDREADYFERRDELADLISGADRMRMQNDSDYANCVMLAASLLKEPELSEKMLDTAIYILKSFQSPSQKTR